MTPVDDPRPLLPSEPQDVLRSPALVHLSAAWFGLAYLWNGLHAILLPVMLIGLVPATLKNTYLGALTFAGLLLAMLVQPVAGAISDRSGWLGQFGKRRPWMAAGAAIDGVLLLLLALAGRFWLLALVYAGLQIASSFVEAALQSLLPDRVPTTQRGRASGYKNAAQIAGFVAGVGMGGFFASRGQVGLALAAAGVALLSTVAWTVLGVHESPAPRRGRKTVGAIDAVRHSFRIDRRVAPAYARLLGGRALLMAGYFALQGFAQFFIADKLGVPNPVGTTALLMAVMGAAIFLLAVPTGVLADRVGRRPLNLFAGLLGAAATGALLLVHNVWQLVVVGGLIGASAGIFMSVNWAWAADLVPPAEAGRYLGLTNVATAGASAVSRLLAGPIIDGGNALRAGIGYDLLFLILALGMMAGTAVLAGVPETQSLPAQPVAEPITVSEPPGE